MSSTTRAALLSALALQAATAGAAESAAPAISFSGYGTLGVVHSSEDRADVTATNFQPSGAGYTRNWSPDVDSRLGGQVTAEFNRQWSAVVQVVTEQRWDGSWHPQLEWANVKYEVSPDLSIRAGRIALPTFLASNSRKVGYTMPWVRVPNTVYGALAMTNSDGADVSYTFQAAGARDTVVVYAGRNNSTYPFGNGEGYHERARRMRGVANTVTYGAATVLLSHFEARLSSDELALADLPYTVNAVGGSYDPGAWFLMAEWARISGHGAGVPSWYVGGGYRIGEFTPYLNYNRRNQMSVQIRQADLAQQSVAIGQRGVSAGVRWDFRPGTDLKLQYDRNQPNDGSIGTLVNPQPGLQPGHRFHVVSVAMDFVF
ncbi:porin [Rugamonas apoptosis]|uniref:Porin n=1 Tax=Rugamonas apoptosis TaxID=2758570 RepID=A0A7W2FDY4_9BURK|nr:porin [Rugamonas apoptosis]MBA5689915.1 porin [Rugamonas apoptosis]